MLKIRLYLMALVGVCFAACTQRQPIYSKPTVNNRDYRVEYLFEHDGCKVYRFQDMGHWIYFTNCQGEAIMQTDSSSVIRNTTHRKQ